MGLDFGLLSSTWWSSLVLTLLTLGFALVLFSKYTFSYWTRKGIKSAEGSLPWGSIKNFVLSRKSIGEVFEDIYKVGEGLPIVGYYSFISPALVLRDPLLIKNVFVKDFDHFSDRGIYHNEKVDPLSAHLFSLDGSKWKDMRSKLSPTYSSGKIRFMFNTVKTCAFKLPEHISDISESSSGGSCDILKLSSRYGLNVIATTAVGLDSYGFEGENPLADAAHQVVNPSDFVQSLRLTLSFVSPALARFFNMRFTPKGVAEFYIDLVEKIVTHRKTNAVVRNDFMQILINMNEDVEKNKGTDVFSINDMAAQTFLFIFAGHESTSSTMSFLLYELAVNEDIQNKLIDEIDSIDGDVSYETLKELKYLDMVFNETLRKYPPGPILIRKCVKDYTISNGFIIKKGTQVTIPAYALHLDSKYFPEPDKFDPERFNKENPSQIIQPGTYLPFGEGPRFCVGKRFGISTVKLGIVSILSKFRVEKNEFTEIPLTLEPRNFVIVPRNGMNLRFVPRKI